MTPQQLKNSILQYAIQGKLVEQRKEEGTAEELYKKIQKEKEKLIKEGKIKKQKALPAIREDEIPFDIPESWKWVRLGEIAEINGGYAFKTNNYTEHGVRVIRISDFNEVGFVNSKIIRHPYDAILNQYILKAKSILMCMTGGTVGKTLFIRNIEERMVTNQRVATINVKIALSEYVYNTIISRFIQKIIQESKNSTNDNISMNTIKGFLVPLPPLEEQKRIVAKIEELLPYVNEYAKAYDELEKLNAKFPESMKKSILQYAIQGKLVEQRKEEGTAEELYKKIQEEKQKLIKERKIKKLKALPEITEDEIPFEIPESWKWVRLGNIIYLLSGADLESSMYSNKEIGIPYITGASNILNNELLINRWTESPKNIANKGDLLITCKGTIGKTHILKENKVHIARQIMSITPFLTNIFYINFFVECNIEKLKKIAKSMIPGIDRNNILNLKIPLPPLEEQKRIVAKIEELLPLCKNLNF